MTNDEIIRIRLNKERKRLQRAAIDLAIVERAVGELLDLLEFLPSPSGPSHEREEEEGQQAA